MATSVFWKRCRSLELSTSPATTCTSWSRAEGIREVRGVFREHDEPGAALGGHRDESRDEVPIVRAVVAGRGLHDRDGDRVHDALPPSEPAAGRDSAPGSASVTG